ncbi:hypothetical protein [Thiobacillus sedimenti]|uniref:Uncharacterized protein n=1 Tax=Thiobacillus sedimenti TaxID=3110231 RepID=A0ABZ1CEQ5_9PROT|nr:hypothetical protein [Thiobacillus sp. SCUT-2]WRS37847.1 hypothetical protein VA613_07395 [Thiobacillus sp. SCUT-2]
MIRLPQALNAWDTPNFRDVAKQEITQLDAGLLPLQQGLSSSSHVTESPFHPVILASHADADRISVKAGIFYTGIIAGCSCADDPTPIDEQTEYCIVRFDIDRTTGDATVTLLNE